MTRIAGFLRDESGVVAVEYALVMTLISGAIITAAATFQAKLANIYNQTAQNLGSVMDQVPGR
jgi:Flp pilus assembly pilin Flp